MPGSRSGPPAPGRERVLAAIAARRASLLAGRGRDDGRRLGVIAEGGAMRAIVSGGALVGLADLGLTDVFDVAYGTSAGAINLAYFLTGEGESAASIYTRHAASLRFVNPLRIGRIIDLDYLFDEVIKPLHPIDLERLRTCATELKVSVTDALTGRNRLVSSREPGVDLYDLLKASSAVPFYHGRTVALPGGHYVDGLVSEALPVRQALADGCTEVLVLASSRAGEGSGRPRRPGRHDIIWPERLLLRRETLGFRRAYLTRRLRLRRALAVARADERVHLVQPQAGSPVPGRTSRDERQLGRAFEAARASVAILFEPYLGAPPAAR